MPGSIKFEGNPYSLTPSPSLLGARMHPIVQTLHLKMTHVLGVI